MYHAEILILYHTYLSSNSRAQLSQLRCTAALRSTFLWFLAAPPWPGKTGAARSRGHLHIPAWLEPSTSGYSRSFLNWFNLTACKIQPQRSAPLSRFWFFLLVIRDKETSLQPPFIEKTDRLVFISESYIAALGFPFIPLQFAACEQLCEIPVTPPSNGPS